MTDHDEKKRKRATKALMTKRVDQVLDMMILRRMCDRKIKQALAESEKIHPKTAGRCIKKARKILAGVGNQASTEERGLLIERLEALYTAEQSSETPNRQLILQMLQLQLNVNKTNPNLKGIKNENTNPTTTTLSPELASIIETLGIDDVAQES